MKCGEIIDRLEQCFPPAYAEEWDNVGLLAGDRNTEVAKVMLALDATEDVVRQAADWGAQLLVTHHPMIFHGLKRVVKEDFVGRKILCLAENGISYYAMHTNFDVMGMADALADMLGLKEREVLMEVVPSGETAYTVDRPQGIGRIGCLEKEMPLARCGMFVKEALSLPFVTVSGDPDRRVYRAAVSSGSGKGVISYALAKGADVLIAGDIGHHEALDAGEQGLCIIDAGHYGTEKLFSGFMSKWFCKEFPEVICRQADQKEPFRVY